MKLARFALPLTLLLPACGARSGPEVYLAPGVPFLLRPPEDGPELFATQEVLFRMPGDRQETALAALENHAGVLTLVASTPMGQTLLTVRLQGPASTVDARIPIPGDLDPRALAGLVQFSLWPAASLRRGLTDPATEIQEQDATRTLLKKGRIIWTATREGAAPPYREVLLANPALQLSVRIRTLTP
jgi:hypothetical protein